MSTTDFQTIREGLSFGRSLIGKVPDDRQMAYRILDKALAALDRLQSQQSQQPKRLTEEEIERIVDQTEIDLRIVHGNAKFDPETFAHECFRYARDHGYIGGLTVDVVMEVVDEWLWFIVFGNESEYQKAANRGPKMNDLRARLTAKLSTP